MENSVTGTNHPKRDREKAAEAHKTSVEVSQLRPSLVSVEMKQLYFIALPEFEGEMSVGIGRVCKLVMAGEQLTAAAVEWLARRGWSNEPTEPGFKWGRSPMFDAFKDGGRGVATNEHPIADFLPVKVELTEGSAHSEPASLAHKNQRFCLQHSCVVRLREFCMRVRPELLNKQAELKPKPKPKSARLSKKP